MLDKLKLSIRKKYGKSYTIQNINLDLRKKQKRVLIAYINNSLHFDITGDGVYHTNSLEQAQVLKVFSDLDYCIDTCHVLDPLTLEYIGHKKYDIIFGLGDTFVEMCRRNPQAKKIMYLTETPPERSFEKERERQQYYKERTTKNVPISRTGLYYKKEHFSNLEYGVYIGEKELYEHYDFKKLYHIYVTGLKNPKYNYKNRNIEESKKHFLWFGSKGAVHKGLDILLEVFSKREDIYLHVAGLSEEDKKYIDIPKAENIINHGMLNVQGEEYLNLVDKCSFVILPSCAEGMSTAVMTCMRHSMIPVVTEKTGYDKLSELAFILKDYKVQYISETLSEITALEEVKIAELHEKVYAFSEENFNLNRFTERFKEIILDIT